LSRETDGVVEENLVTSGLDDQGRQAGQVGEYRADEAKSGVLSRRIVGDSGMEGFSAHQLLLAAGAIVVFVPLAPQLLPEWHEGRLGRALVALRRILLSVRSGLRVFGKWGTGVRATVAQLAAWTLQVVSAYTVILALGLDDRVGFAAAAAAILAVNVTAVVPVTPANVGVFQVAVAAVLTAGYGLSAGSALAYGIVLQAVEVVTAVALGMPAVLREGMTWSDLRLQALRAVELTPRDDRVTSGHTG
jgi:phosphatidylinositol alpha-mannosyltransferase